MCRYANKIYKSHFACFNCRKTFKESYPRSYFDKKQKMAVDTEDFLEVRICPQCRGEMFDMGFDFKAPKQTDIKQWKKVEILFRNGFTFHSCGCGPGLGPAELNQVKEFLNGNLVKSEGEKLLALIAEKRRIRLRK